jgi:hypothetical protein
MEDFLNNITSISWWIGVFIVGILINLVAIYLKSPIDKWRSLISTKSRTRSKAKKAERETKIANLVGNKPEQILHASEINFTLLVSASWHLSGIFVVIMVSLLVVLVSTHGPVLVGSLIFKIPGTILLISGMLMLLLGSFNFSKALDDRQILKEAKDKESKISSNEQA